MPKARKGLASFDDPEERKRIARLGGLAAHAKKTAHRFTPEEVKRGGEKGGAVNRAVPGRMKQVAQAKRKANTQGELNHDRTDEESRSEQDQ